MMRSEEMHNSVTQRGHGAKNSIEKTLGRFIALRGELGRGMGISSKKQEASYIQHSYARIRCSRRNTISSVGAREFSQSNEKGEVGRLESRGSYVQIIE